MNDRYTFTPATTLPDAYGLSDEECTSRIRNIIDEVKHRAIILAHNYQNDSIVEFADYTGDSLELAKRSVASDKEIIVFCGVHFMAESADILNFGKKIVTLPNLEAGCALADMITPEALQFAWHTLDDEENIVPITYINSSAEIKAFCGEHNGLTCTSGNARTLFKRYLDDGKRIFSMPDENLGTNTALSLGLMSEDIAVWNPLSKTLEGDKNARIIVWKGYCPVHTPFSTEDIIRVRLEYPGIHVIVHPECRPEVAAVADDMGSTAYIIERVNAGKHGDIWAIGTEVNLVRRLQKEHPEQTIIGLKQFSCACSTMSRIQPQYLLWNLASLLQNKIVNHISVPVETAEKARIALERMLS
jgi:quinolinate synthase